MRQSTVTVTMHPSFNNVSRVELLSTRNPEMRQAKPMPANCPRPGPQHAQRRQLDRSQGAHSLSGLFYVRNRDTSSAVRISGFCSCLTDGWLHLGGPNIEPVYLEYCTYIHKQYVITHIQTEEGLMDRPTDRQTGRQADRQANRHSHAYILITYIHTHIHTCIHTNMLAYIHMCIHEYTHT